MKHSANANGVSALNAGEHLVDTAFVPDGTRLRLIRSGTDFAILLDDTELMSTDFSASEGVLASAVCAELGDRDPVHMLIGGYGMGYTLRSALRLLGSDAEVKEAADSLYRELSHSGASVLYDDRELSAGVKFADADLIGIYERVIVSRRSIDQGVVELLNRFTGVSRKVSDREVICAHIKVRDINEKTDI